MNNPEMYNSKKSKNGLIKYYLLWSVVILISVVLLIAATYNRNKNNFEWNLNELQEALDEEKKSDDFVDKYHYDIKNVYKIEASFDHMICSIKVYYSFENEVGSKKKAIGYSNWFTNSSKNDDISELITKFDQSMKKYEISADDYEIRFIDSTKVSFLTYLLNILPYIVIGIVALILLKNFMKSQLSANNNSLDFGKSKAKLEDTSKIRFSDVAGCDDEKAEMVELVDYLKNPAKYAQAGAHIPKGVILKGNPGTGKTLLAKAVAGEASVPFYYISGSDFLEMYVGVGASRVRDMFKKARAAAPCIIFIDEIDAIGRQRGTGLGGGHDEREQTLNQLLVEMDGFEGNSGLIVLAATNRIDILDPALLRPGRFDRQIEVSLPDLKGRVEILKVHARNKKLSSEVSLDSVASRTPGFSGAELENVLNEAAILSVRNKHRKISTADIDEAIDRVLSGPAKKTKVISERGKRITAYHEAGHAVIGLKLNYAEKVQKITIIPRANAYGYVMMTPKDESVNQTKSELEAKIVSYLAGRASEELFFEDVTTGAFDDIKRATKIARAMVTELGMSSLGPVHYEDEDGQVFLGRDYGSNKISGSVADEINQEVRKIINKCLEQAKTIIKENKDLLTLIAEALIKYETITADEVDFLVKYGSLDAYEAFKKNNEKLALEEEKEVSEQVSENLTSEVKQENNEEIKDENGK